MSRNTSSRKTFSCLGSITTSWFTPAIKVFDKYSWEDKGQLPHRICACVFCIWLHFGSNYIDWFPQISMNQPKFKTKWKFMHKRDVYACLKWCHSYSEWAGLNYYVIKDWESHKNDFTPLREMGQWYYKKEPKHFLWLPVLIMLQLSPDVKLTTSSSNSWCIQ